VHGREKSPTIPLFAPFAVLQIEHICVCCRHRMRPVVQHNAYICVCGAAGVVQLKVLAHICANDVVEKSEDDRFSVTVPL